MSNNNNEESNQSGNSKTKKKQGFAAHPESINRNGRPPKERAIAHLQAEYLKGTIDTEGGKITREEALVKAWYDMALNDPGAMRGFVAHLEPEPTQSIETEMTTTIQLIDPEEKNV